VGNRPAHERSVFAPRRTVIIVDLAATLAIVPVPTIARVLRCTVELLLGDVGAVPTKAGVIAEGCPWDRIVVVADAQEAAKAEHGIGHMAASLVDHDTLDGTNLLACGAIDIRAFHFVAADEASGLPRFRCHWMRKRNRKVAVHACPSIPLNTGREERRGGTVGRGWSSRRAQPGVARCTPAGPWLESNL